MAENNRKRDSESTSELEFEDKKEWSIGCSIGVGILVVVIVFTILGLFIALTSKKDRKSKIIDILDIFSRIVLKMS